MYIATVFTETYPGPGPVTQNIPFVLLGDSTQYSYQIICTGTLAVDGTVYESCDGVTFSEVSSAIVSAPSGGTAILSVASTGAYASQLQIVASGIGDLTILFSIKQ